MRMVKLARRFRFGKGGTLGHAPRLHLVDPPHALRHADRVYVAALVDVERCAGPDPGGQRSPRPCCRACCGAPHQRGARGLSRPRARPCRDCQARRKMTARPCTPIRRRVAVRRHHT